MENCQHQKLKAEELQVCRSRDCTQPIKVCCPGCKEQLHNHQHQTFSNLDDIQKKLEPLMERTMNRLLLSRKISELFEKKLLETTRELYFRKDQMEKVCDTSMPLNIAQSISDMVNGEFIDTSVLELLCDGELLRSQKEVWMKDFSVDDIMPRINCVFDDFEDYWKRLRELVGHGGQPRKVVKVNRDPREQSKHIQQPQAPVEVRKEQQLHLKPSRPVHRSTHGDDYELESNCQTILDYKDDVCATFTSLTDGLYNVQNYCSNSALSVRLPIFDPSNKKDLSDYTMIVRLVSEFEDLERLTLIFSNPITDEMMRPIDEWLSKIPKLQELNVLLAKKEDYKATPMKNPVPQLSQRHCRIDITTSTEGLLQPTSD